MSDKIVEHHIKYVETHGYDETEFITDTEHQRINHRELFPMVTPEELAKISRDAYKRTRKMKDNRRDYIRENCFIRPSREHMKQLTQNKPII